MIGASLTVVFYVHRVFYGVESWSGVLEWSIGVESDFGVAKEEKSAFVMCVCGQVLCTLVIVMDQ